MFFFFSGHCFSNFTPFEFLRRCLTIIHLFLSFYGFFVFWDSFFPSFEQCFLLILSCLFFLYVLVFSFLSLNFFPLLFIVKPSGRCQWNLRAYHESNNPYGSLKSCKHTMSQNYEKFSRLWENFTHLFSFFIKSHGHIMPESNCWSFDKWLAILAPWFTCIFFSSFFFFFRNLNYKGAEKN